MWGTVRLSLFRGVYNLVKGCSRDGGAVSSAPAALEAFKNVQCSAVDGAVPITWPLLGYD